ncbi:MAG: hypothetical protein HY318_16070 [Armatimonadetes bacterium]|nr:hypothetical protein [Armatimonadota bacterium]
MKHIPILLMCLVTVPCFAEEIAVVKAETRVPLGETKRFEFGTVPQRDTTVLLEVFSRLDAKDFGGSMYFMKVVLNGHVVQAAKTRTVTRLRNRPVVSPVAANVPYSWYGADSWRVLYAPNFEGALKQTFYEGNPYQLVLDVTDLTNPAAENRLEITNLATESTLLYAGSKADLVLQSLTIRTQAGASPTMTSEATDRDTINRGAPGAGPAFYTGQLLPGGGFSLNAKGETFEFTSALSFPNAGLNLLTPAQSPKATGQKGWTVRILPNKEGGQVLGEGPDYRLRRTVRFTSRKVDIADEITNLHGDQKLGLSVKNQVSLRGKSANVRLAGNPDPAINEYYSNGNPTVYVALKDKGLGFVCEDDVLRNQATLYYDSQEEAAGLRTDMLCLQPGETYTLRWSAYPVASNDYYDFINLVRQDWGSNYPVEGAWTFFDPDAIIGTSVEEIRRQFQRLGIRYACYCGGWVDRKHDQKKIGFGAGVMDPYWEDFRSRLCDAALKIRKAVPDCKVLVYYDSQRDTSEGGHERFKDSWLTDVKGEQLSTDWSGVYSLTYSVVATLNNSYGKALLEVADRYLNEIKADGLYWDEMETVGYGTPLITCNIPDGHSCLLDRKTFTIGREVGVTTLLGESHRLAVIDRVRAKGGTLMGNGPTTTKSILARKPQRMVEIQHNDTWSYEGNLDSPLGYASSRRDFGNWVRAIRLATLLVGTSYNYDYDFPAYVFPFTPIELHAGYMLGKERIITTHSGSYGWPNEKCLVKVHHFDKAGNHVDRDYIITLGREARTPVEVPDGEAAILERLPVLLLPQAGTAEVRKLRYDEKACSFVLQAQSGVLLRIASGALKITPGQRFDVTIGEATGSVPAGNDSRLSLRLEVNADRPLRIIIRPTRP